MDVRDLLAKETTITPQLKVEFASDTAHENLILGILSDIYQYSALAGFALISLPLCCYCIITLVEWGLSNFGL